MPPIPAQATLWHEVPITGNSVGRHYLQTFKLVIIKRKSVPLVISYGINVGMFYGESALLNKGGLRHFAVNSAETPQSYESLLMKPR